MADCERQTTIPSQVRRSCIGLRFKVSRLAGRSEQGCTIQNPVCRLLTLLPKSPDAANCGTGRQEEHQGASARAFPRGLPLDAAGAHLRGETRQPLSRRQNHRRRLPRQRPGSAQRRARHVAAQGRHLRAAHPRSGRAARPSAKRCSMCTRTYLGSRLGPDARARWQCPPRPAARGHAAR